MSWRAAWSARNPPKAASAHRSPEAAVSVHGSPEAAVSAHSPLRRRCPLTVPQRRWFPLKVPLRQQCLLTGLAHSSLKAAVSADVPHTDVPPEAVEPIIARSRVAAPHTPLWWPLVLPWVPIPPALPQSPGPPPAHGPAPPPHPSPCSAIPLVRYLGTSGIRSVEGGLCQESGLCISPSRHQRSLSPGLRFPNSTHLCDYTLSCFTLSRTIYTTTPPLHCLASLIVFVWYVRLPDFVSNSVPALFCIVGLFVY